MILIPEYRDCNFGYVPLRPVGVLAPPVFTVQRACVSVCAVLAGLSYQISDVLSPDLIGATPAEQNDQWAVHRAHYMTLETIAPLGEDEFIKLPPVAA